MWTEQTFDKLVAGVPERLTQPDEGRQRDAGQRRLPRGGRLRGDAAAAHRQPRGAARPAPAGPPGAAAGALAACAPASSPGSTSSTSFGRRYVLTVDLPDDFALNQPLAHFALAAFDVLDPESETYGLDVVSIVESVLEAPRQILMAQQHAARGEAIGEMKADGLEYDERMALLEEITWPQPLRELLEALYETYRQTHPWLPEDALGAEVGRAGDVGERDGLHRLRRPLPARPVRGPGAALPHRRLPDPAPDRARGAPRARGRGRHRVAGGDGAADRLLAARRVGGAVGPRPRPSSASPTTSRRRRRGRCRSRSARSG